MSRVIAKSLVLILSLSLLLQSLVNPGRPELSNSRFSKDEHDEKGGGQRDQGWHEPDPNLLRGQGHYAETQACICNSFRYGSIPMKFSNK